MPEHAHVGHRKRLKKRFSTEGLDHFSPHEVLELLLTFAIPQRDVNPLAHDLVDHFGSLRGVFDATAEELREVPGVGDHCATLIRLAADIPRYLATANEAQEGNIALNNAQSGGKFFIDYLSNEPYECFAMAMLRSDYTLLRAQKLNRGNLVETPVFVRRTIELALRQHAYGVLIAHNHPSGSCRPSQQDVEITEVLQQALEAVDIRLLDHFVVTRERSFSIFSNNLVRPPKRMRGIGIADPGFDLNDVWHD